MANEIMDEEEFKRGLQEIIDSLGWFIFHKCKCGKKIKVPALDSEYSCSKCGTIYNDYCSLPEYCEVYQELFLEAIRGSFKEKIDVTDEYRYHFIKAYTSLEIFFQQIARDKLEKKHTNKEVISFILEEMRPDFELYLKLLQCLEVKETKQGKKFRDLLASTRAIRNNIVHRGYSPSDEQILKAFESIAEIFHILHPHSIFDRKRKIPPTEWVDLDNNE